MFIDGCNWNLSGAKLDNYCIQCHIHYTSNNILLGEEISFAWKSDIS